jgi:hypothetical protein
MLPASAGAISKTAIAGGHSFPQPSYVTQPPSTGPILVVERSGLIRAVRRGHVLGRPFLDIRSRVAVIGEGGLLSVAFPPDYGNSRKFYVYYSNNSGNIEVDEFKRSSSSNARASASTRRRVITIGHPNGSCCHWGGQLQFDAQRHLYLAPGDGATGGDEARDTSSLLGKVLRINPRKRGSRRYTIPSTNPYVGVAGRDEIFSIGLRNPFRFSIDRAGSSQFIAIGDVGQNTREEVDFESLGTASGADFGWNNFEGDLNYPALTPAGPQPNPPALTYANAGSRCAVIGGYVVRLSSSPLYGRYLYTDLCDGVIRSFIPGIESATDDRVEGGTTVANPVSFGVDRRRRLYVVSNGGPVYRLGL